MKKVVITKKLPFDISQYLGDIRIDANGSEEQLPLLRLRQMVSDADAIISSSADIIDKTLIDSSPKLKIIANYSTSYANIDIDYARKKGIIVCAANNALTQDTAELIFALLMASAKHVAYEDRAARGLVHGGKEEHRPLGFYKKTMGILGMDNIGQATAKIATGFSMDIIYNDSVRNYQSELLLGATFAEFDELMEWSDFIVISTIFDDFIKEKITAARFKQMKRSAVVVGLGAAQKFEVKDLIAALKEGTIAAAGLDIGDLPEREAEILKTIDNAALMPDNPGGSAQSVKLEMAKICARCVVSVLKDGVVPDNAITV